MGAFMSLLSSRRRREEKGSRGSVGGSGGLAVALADVVEGGLAFALRPFLQKGDAAVEVPVVRGNRALDLVELQRKLVVERLQPLLETGDSLGDPLIVVAQAFHRDLGVPDLLPEIGVLPGDLLVEIGVLPGGLLVETVVVLQALAETLVEIGD